MPKTITQVALLDKYGFPLQSPITLGSLPEKIVAYQLGIQQRIQTKRIKTSAVSIASFVNFLSSTALALGTVSSGGSAFLSTTLTPQSPHATDPNFAIAYLGVFVGTSSSSYQAAQQLYPTVGGSQTPGKWDIRGDYDYNGANGTLSGTISAWNGVVINNSGATGTIQFVTRWKYINFNAGTVV